MKALTTSEKFELIRSHGMILSRTNMAVSSPRRADIIESAQRVIELAKSIPKLEFGE